MRVINALAFGKNFKPLDGATSRVIDPPSTSIACTLALITRIGWRNRMRVQPAMLR